MKKLPATFDILRVTPDMVKRVYSGRPGCGCGCRGTYSDSKVAKTRILNVLKANADKIRQHRGFVSENEQIFALETETRYRWVYANLDKLREIA